MSQAILDKLIDGLEHDPDWDGCLELSHALRPAMAVAESILDNTGIAIRTVENGIQIGSNDTASGHWPTPARTAEFDVVLTLRLSLEQRNELLCFLATS